MAKRPRFGAVKHPKVKAAFERELRSKNWSERFVPTTTVLYRRSPISDRAEYAALACPRTLDKVVGHWQEAHRRAFAKRNRCGEGSGSSPTAAFKMAQSAMLKKIR